MLGAALLLVVACGGAPEPATEHVVGLAEFAFDPAAVAVPAGSEVTVDVENRGTIVHDWIVVLPGVEVRDENDIPLEITDDFALASIELEPGASGTVGFAAPEAGTYQIICATPGHFTAGMEGELIVSG